MSSLVDATSALSLEKLDYWERFIRWELLKALGSATTSAWGSWERPTPFPTWVDLCSEDGSRRESILRAVSEGAPNSFFLTLAVRRLNDWVPQVRKAAREKLPVVARASDPEHVVDALCATLPHWNSWGRMREAGRQVLLGMTAVGEVAQSLKSRIISSTSGPMALILAQAGRVEVLDHFLGEIAKEAKQPSVRATAYRSQLERKMVWLEGRKWEWTDMEKCSGRFMPVLSERDLAVAAPLLGTLNLAAEDRSPRVRRVAGDILIQESKSLGTEARNIATKLALDAFPSVADRGQFALKKLGLDEP